MKNVVTEIAHERQGVFNVSIRNGERHGINKITFAGNWMSIIYNKGSQLKQTQNNQKYYHARQLIYRQKDNCWKGLLDSHVNSMRRECFSWHRLRVRGLLYLSRRNCLLNVKKIHR